MKKLPVKIYVLIIATLASFLSPFITSAVNVALPVIVSDFQIDTVIQNWIAASYLLSAAIFAVPFGRISEIYGMKKVFTWGILIYTISAFLAAIAPSALLLIIFRIIQGTGSAMIFVTSLALIGAVFPLMERGKAIGITVGMVYTGLTLGPILGGMLTRNLGWPYIFLITIPLGILILILIRLTIKEEWAEEKGEKFDLTGSFLYAIALFMLMYGFSTLPNLTSLLIFIGGILFMGIFIKWELKHSSPILNMKLFRNVTYASSSLAAFINYSATFAVALLLSFFLQYIKGLDSQITGLILVVQPMIMAMVAPLAGKLSDKEDPQILAAVGLAISTVSLFILSFINEDSSISFIIISLLILGLGFGMFSSPNTKAIMGSVERKYYGIASATVSSVRLIGQSFSIGIVTVIFSLLIGRIPITVDLFPVLIKSTQIAFLIFTVLCFSGIMILLKTKIKN